MVRARLRRWLRELRADPEEIGDIVVAFGEVCTNAVEHSASRPESLIHIRGSILNGVVRLSVRDFGRWRFESKAGRGRGLLLARSLMDQIAVRCYLDGTEVMLYRRLQTSSMQRATMTLQAEAGLRAGRVA